MNLREVAKHIVKTSKSKLHHERHVAITDEDAVVLAIATIESLNMFIVNDANQAHTNQQLIEELKNY